MAQKERQHGLVVLSGYVFLRRGDAVLLTRRFNTGYRDGDYSLPAGHLEDREFAIAGALRELKEEIGVIVSPSDLKPVHVMHRLCGDHERIDFFFEATNWEGSRQFWSRIDLMICSGRRLMRCPKIRFRIFVRHSRSIRRGSSTRSLKSLRIRWGRTVCI